MSSNAVTDVGALALANNLMSHGSTLLQSLSLHACLIGDKGVLQCVAVCCSVLRVTAVPHCSLSRCTPVLLEIKVCCNVLQCVAVSLAARMSYWR